MREKTGLMNEIEIMGSETSENYPHEQLVGMESVMKLIDQLDEPEVLTQEWIDEHVVHVRGLGDILEAVSVENLLVPKQELPVVPKFIADFIEARKNVFMNTLQHVFHRAMDNRKSELFEEEYDWVRHNSETFARAWLDGYEVEEEQKYYVLDSEDIPLLERANNQTCKTTTGLSIYEDGRDNSMFELTEKEIKDYDERFWLFAKEVAE